MEESALVAKAEKYLKEISMTVLAWIILMNLKISKDYIIN